MTAILKVDEIQDTSGNLIIKEDSNTVTIGKAGDTVNVVGTLQNNSSALISGITEADQWRLTSNLNTAGSDLTANLERVDTDTFEYIGTGMSQSSGIFTFPSTGIYLIIFDIVSSGNSDGDIRYAGGGIFTTTNNSTYNERSVSYNGCNNHGANYYMSTTQRVIFNVSNTSTHKVKFNVGASAAINFKGDTNRNETAMTFLRLGDT